MRCRVAPGLGVVMLALLACSSTPQAPGASSRPGAPAATGSGRTLSIAIRAEPEYLAILTPLGQGGVNSGLFEVPALFNATMAVLDHHDVASPLLAEALPEFNSPSWVLNPDGTMRTTF